MYNGGIESEIKQVNRHGEKINKDIEQNSERPGHRCLDFPCISILSRHMNGTSSRKAENRRF